MDSISNLDQTPLYRMHEDNKQVDDIGSPLGYWEQSVSYPMLDDSLPSANAINKAIKAKAYEYSCGELGDYTFNSTVHSIDQSLLSVSFESMWLCPQMPGPDSDSGSFVFNVKTGEPVTLKNEFVDQEAFSTFIREITAKLQKSISDKSKFNEAECESPSGYSYFYKRNDELIFVSSPDMHSDSSCASEIKIPISDIRSHLSKGSALLEP